MELIDSFKIDHTKLNCGIYISRVDEIDGSFVTTFDIRVKKPNYEDAMSSAASHTIEHLAATYFRNLDYFKDKVIYFGPMGCLTGFYLILKGQYNYDTDNYKEAIQTIMNMFSFVVKFNGQIPGATKVECGNYKLNDLEAAKFIAANMLVMYYDLKILSFRYNEEELVSLNVPENSDDDIIEIESNEEEIVQLVSLDPTKTVPLF